MVIKKRQGPREGAVVPSENPASKTQSQRRAETRQASRRRRFARGRRTSIYACVHWMSVERVRGVLFDFGRALASHPREEIIKAILQGCGPNVNETDLRRGLFEADRLWSQNCSGTKEQWGEDVALVLNEVIVKEIGALEHAQETAHRIYESWEGYSERYGYVLYPDTALCLKDLKEMGQRLGVVSNCPSSAFLENHLRRGRPCVLELGMAIIGFGCPILNPLLVLRRR